MKRAAEEAVVGQTKKARVSPTDPSSAANTALGIAELLENVLLQLPTPEAIVAVQRVSRKFRDVTLESPVLRKRAFLKVDKKVQPCGADHSFASEPSRALEAVAINRALLNSLLPWDYSPVYSWPDGDNTGEHVYAQTMMVDAL